MGELYALLLQKNRAKTEFQLKKHRLKLKRRNVILPKGHLNLASRKASKNAIKICPQQVFTFQAQKQSLQGVLEFAHNTTATNLYQKCGEGNPGIFYSFKQNDFNAIKDLKKLHQWINNCLSKAQQNVSWNSDYYPDLCITQSWLNILEAGHDHAMHVHPLSILSGVLCLSHRVKLNLYVQSIYSLPTFLCPDLTDSCLLIKQTLELEFGDLILFPSSLRHDVSTHDQLEKRLTLSFNSFFTGTIGDASLLAMLKRSE